jgi:hypothetical protein
MTPWTRIPRASSSSRTTHSGICLPRFFHQQRYTTILWEREMWKVTPLLPSRDRRALTVALNPSAVPGTIIKFSPYIWAVRLLGHRVFNHARKPRVSVTPITKTGVLLADPLRERPQPQWCQLACCPEARTYRQTCACWLPPKRQQVLKSPNQWLRAWAAHSADGG